MARGTFGTLRTALAGAALMTALTSGAAFAGDHGVAEYGMSLDELARMQRLPSVSAAAERFAPGARGSARFVRPALGRISTPFGERGRHWRLGYHPGLDIAVPTGTPVRAVEDGVVIEAEPTGHNNGYGHYVKIDHGNGMHSLYAHLSVPRVAVGEQVSAGQVIGLSGNTGYSTGPHLHLEIRQNGEKLDPAPFLGIKS